MSRRNRVAPIAYRAVEAVLRGRTAQAVELQVGGLMSWVPVVWLDLRSAEAAAAAEIGATLTLRVQDWKARELGWGARPANQPKLL